VSGERESSLADPHGGPAATAKIKNYSHDNLLKETELKAALTGSTVWQKAAR
jgi:hypothetical protein